jgi:preprotein translocase subunit SecE
LETDALTKLSYTPKARAQIAAPPAIRKALGASRGPAALAIASSPRYLANLAYIGKARLTGPPVESGCPKGAERKKDEGEVARVNPGEFLRQVRAETGKVSWPTRKETVTTGIMVLIMTTLLGIFFFAVDNAFAALVTSLLGLLS